MRSRRRKQPFSLFSFQDIITSVTGIVILITLVLTLDLITRRQNAGGDVSSQVSAAEIEHEIERLQREVDVIRRQASDHKAQLEEAAEMSEVQIEIAISDAQAQINGLADQLAELEHDRHVTEEQVRQTKSTADNRSGDRERLETLERQNAETLDELKTIQRENWVIYNPSDQFGKKAWLVDLQEDKIAVSVTGGDGESVTFESRFTSSAKSQFLKWVEGRAPHAEYFVLLVRPSSSTLYDAIQASLESDGFDLGVDLLGESDTLAEIDEGVIPE